VSGRKERRKLIRSLLQKHTVGSQEQLAGLLRDAGVSCTQATLSRDLRDMGIIRDRGVDGPVYRIDQRARYRKVLRQVVGMEITSVRHNGSLVVLRTLVGRAGGVAGYLDGWGNPKILGTIAGDDTVFVAPSNPSECIALAAEIRDLAQGEQELL
jgi:transcriptional regulator of arginine metabolism